MLGLSIVVVLTFLTWQRPESRDNEQEEWILGSRYAFTGSSTSCRNSIVWRESLTYVHILGGASRCSSIT